MACYLCDSDRFKLRDGGKLIIEVPNSEDALLGLYESEAFSKFTYWSCHLFLFNAKTLQDLVSQCGLSRAYEDALASIGKTDTLIAQISKG